METITKVKYVKDKVTGEKKKVETTYNVSADFVPKEISEISAEFIENYCVANKETKWLVSEVQKTITDKQGKVRDLPFVSLRAEFTKKFFPSIIKEKKGSKSFKDTILEKYGK